MLDYTVKDWFKRLVSGEPHHIIGSGDEVYMLRWYLIPRNRFFNIYLHKFLRSDEDRALHDHPWWFISLLIKGQYEEITKEQKLIGMCPFCKESECLCGYKSLYEIVHSSSVIRKSPSICFRKAEHRHRVQLITETATTIFLTGPKVREWGFWCPQGFVNWKIFTDPKDSGKIGRGCE